MTDRTVTMTAAELPEELRARVYALKERVDALESNLNTLARNWQATDLRSRTTVTDVSIINDNIKDFGERIAFLEKRVTSLMGDMDVIEAKAEGISELHNRINKQREDIYRLLGRLELRISAVEQSPSYHKEVVGHEERLKAIEARLQWLAGRVPLTDEEWEFIGGFYDADEAEQAERMVRQGKQPDEIRAALSEDADIPDAKAKKPTASGPGMALSDEQAAALRANLEEILDGAKTAQGEWVSVVAFRLPGWAMNFRNIQNAARAALDTLDEAGEHEMQS